jgi:hypothetical protein
MEYVDKLQKLTKPITRLVLDSLSFYEFEGQDIKHVPYVVATHLTSVGLEQMIYEFKINNKWDPSEFLNWCNKVKEIPVYPIKVAKVTDDEY